MPVIFLWLRAKVVREDSLHLQKNPEYLNNPKDTLGIHIVVCTAQRGTA